MMSESSDEQPEIVTREEVELAEQQMAEATRISPPKSPQQARGPAVVGSGITPPSPLPSFGSPAGSNVAEMSVTTEVANTPAITPARQSVSPVRPVSDYKSPDVARSSPKPSATTHVSEPETIQTPYEASTNIEVSKEDIEEMNISPQQSPQQNLFGWFNTGGGILNKVVEKTKSSMEKVIATLDPGMKEIMKSGGDIDIVVTSTKEPKVGGVREAFQLVFGKATVTGKETQASGAAQPVGFTAGLNGAEERIQNLRRDAAIDINQPVVSIEGFIVEILPDSWFEMSCLLLVDHLNQIRLQTFSQPTPIPLVYVHQAQDATPKDYPLRWSGLAVTIGELIEKSEPLISRTEWQKALAGISRRDSIYVAAQSLAYMYKQGLSTPSAS